FLLSCLVVLIGCSVWTAHAEGDFESEKARVIQIYGNPDVDKATKIRNAEFLAHFLDKYSGNIQMTPELRTRVTDAVGKYKEEKANQPLVDGAPPQGGFLSSILIGILIDIGIEAAAEGISKAIS
ncbi:hypothetical protein KR200_000529, partial [Drosophila serrata]